MLTTVARKPEECHKLIGQALTAGDLEAVLSLYEPGARMVPDAGADPVSGEQLAEAIEGLVALKPTMTVTTEQVIEAGDVALLRSRWSLSATQPDGSPLNMSHRGAEVVRRQPDGRWLYVIDNPFAGE